MSTDKREAPEPHLHAIEDIVGLQAQFAALQLPPDGGHVGQVLARATVSPGGFKWVDQPKVLTVHAQLAGLTVDDHTQYLTVARANAWYSTKTTDVLPEGHTNKYMHLAGAGRADTAARSDHVHIGYAAAQHGHSIAEVIDLQAALDVKARTFHTHTVTDTPGLQIALDSKAHIIHTHSYDQIPGLRVDLDSKAQVVHIHGLDAITGLGELVGTKAPLVHQHGITDVRGLDVVLAGKADTHNHDYARPVHYHAIADVADLQSALGTKADTTHCHDYSGQFAPSQHTHQWLVPAGGVGGQLLGKRGDDDGDLAWFYPQIPLTAHAQLAGLGADEHKQYLTSARADSWLDTKTSDELAEGHDHIYMHLAGTGSASTAARSDHTHDYSPLFATIGHAHPGMYAPVRHSHTQAEVTDLTSTLAGKANALHQHAIVDVAQLQTQLDAKASVRHAHELEQIAGLRMVLDGKASVAHVHDFRDQFAPLVHQHDIYAKAGHGHQPEEVHGLLARLGGKADSQHGHKATEIGGLAELLTQKADTAHTHDHTALFAPIIHDHPGLYSPIGHSHFLAGIFGLQATLDTKATVGHAHTIADTADLLVALDGKATCCHAHNIVGIAGLQPALDGKAKLVHGHNPEQITGLVAALDAKANAAHHHDASYAARIHVHNVVEVTGLQARLDQKADSGHAHDYTALFAPNGHDHDGRYTQMGHTHPVSSIGNLQNELDNKALAVHTHAVVNVTGLQPVLDNKSSIGHLHSVADTRGLQAVLDSKLPATWIPTWLVPFGGSAGQILAKASDNDGEFTWVDQITGDLKLEDLPPGWDEIDADLWLATKSTDNLVEGYTNKYMHLAGTGVAYTCSHSDHTHDYSLVYAAYVHTHNISAIVDLEAMLGSFAHVVHQHLISDVIGLQDALDTIISPDQTWSIDSVIDLQSELDTLQAEIDNKVDLGTQYNITDIVGLQAALTTIEVGLASKPDVGTLYNITDIVGLQDALNTKLNIGWVPEWLVPGGGAVGQILAKASGNSGDLAWTNQPIVITAHHNLTGLSADDHTQYLNVTRAAAWLATQTTDDLPQGTTNLYMELSGSGSATTAAHADHNHIGVYAPVVHTHVLAAITDFPTPIGQLGKYISSDGTELVWSVPSAVLPVQTGNAGQWLTTNGTTALWAALPVVSLTTDQVLEGTTNQYMHLSGSGSSAFASHSDHIHTIENIAGFPTQTHNAGNILSTDGSVLTWIIPSASIPALTGHAGNWLTTDGTIPIWSQLPTYTTDQIVQGVNNWYFTYGLFDGRLATKTTDNLSEGIVHSYMHLAGTGSAATAAHSDHTHVITSILGWPTLAGNAGQFLTTDGTNLSWSQSTVSYTNASQTPTAIGGIQAGSSFSAQSVQQMFNMLLYPYQAPGFTSFNIVNYSATLEVGTPVPGPINFTFNCSNQSNIQPDSIMVTDQLDDVLITGMSPSNNSMNLALPSTVQLFSPGSFSWTVTGTDTQTGTFSQVTSLAWEWKIFWGPSSNPALDATGVMALANSQLASGFAGTYTQDVNGYKYFAWPGSFGSPSNFIDTSTLMPLPFQAVYQVNITNSQGQITTYNVFRSMNLLNASVNIQVS